MNPTQHHWPAILAMALLAGTVPSCQKPAPTAPAPPPNVVIILADDQGWGDLGAHGNPVLRTPNLDKMARRGASFDQFIVSPVCSPTRAALLTGRYPARGGVFATSEGGERLDLDETTLAQAFRRQGYATAAYGKWHNGSQYPYHPLGRGFDDFYGFCSGHWGHYFSPMLEHNGAVVKGNGYLPDDLTDHAIRFVENHQQQPFLLYLAYNTPHSPMQVPDRWWRAYADAKLDSTHRYAGQEDKAHTRAAYAMCANLDWNVGRLVDKVAQLGMAENTIVVYASDNGPNGWRWNGGMKGKKGYLDDGGTRSPLLVQWPGTIPAGKALPQLASAMDLLPTLADLAGLDFDPPRPLDGKSLAPLLLLPRAVWPERYIANHWRGKTSVRGQHYRLDHQNRLFDLRNDPGQHTDVAGEHDTQAAKMAAYKQWWEQSVLAELATDDMRPIPVGHPDVAFTHLPARDATATGTIARSNQYPNCSYFTNWTSTEDGVAWPVEVLQPGRYEATVYYTCKQQSVGTTMALQSSGGTLTAVVDEAHDPPPTGQAEDRVPRKESYIKDFAPWRMGTIALAQGRDTLRLAAPAIKGGQAIDFRLLVLQRADPL